MDTGRRDTDQFAAALARDVEPVRRLPRLRVIGAGLVLWALSIAAVFVLYLGPRAEVRELEMSVPYAAVIAGLVVFAFGGTLVALGTSVPGREGVARLGSGAIGTAILVWAVAGGGLLVQGAPLGPFDALWMGTTLSCIGIATGIGFLPVLAVLSFVIGAFPYRPLLAAGLGAAAMVAFGSGAVHLTCASDEVLHVSLAHVLLPLTSGALIGVALLRLQRVLAR